MDGRCEYASFSLIRRAFERSLAVMGAASRQRMICSLIVSCLSGFIILPLLKCPKPTVIIHIYQRPGPRPEIQARRAFSPPAGP